MHEKIEMWTAFVWPTITFVLNAFFATWTEERWTQWADSRGLWGQIVLTLKSISQKYGADPGPDLHAKRLGAKGSDDAP